MARSATTDEDIIAIAVTMATSQRSRPHGVAVRYTRRMPATVNS